MIPVTGKVARILADVLELVTVVAPCVELPVTRLMPVIVLAVTLFAVIVPVTLA